MQSEALTTKIKFGDRAVVESQQTQNYLLEIRVGLRWILIR